MRIFGFVLVLAAAMSGGLRSGQAAAPLFDDPVIARGKGIEVKRSQLEDAIIQYKANLAVRGQTLSESQRATREAQLLDRLVITQILLSRATAADKAKAKEFAEKFTTESKKMASSEDMFFRQIKALGLSPEQFQKRVDEQSIAEAVLDRELKSTINISDAQVQDFYKSGVDRLVQIMQEELDRLVKDPSAKSAQVAAVKEQVDRMREANLAKLEAPETVRIIHIFIPTLNRETGDSDSEETKKAKHELMNSLLARARKGEDFAKLVQEFSQDPNLKETKGEYTVARNDSYSPEFKAAAFSLKPDQISEIVKTQLGMHIIKNLEHIPAKKMEFDKVAADIKDHLREQGVQYQMPAFFARIKKEASVEILDPKYTLSTAEETRSLKPPG